MSEHMTKESFVLHLAFFIVAVVCMVVVSGCSIGASGHTDREVESVPTMPVEKWKRNPVIADLDTWQNWNPGEDGLAVLRAGNTDPHMTTEDRIIFNAGVNQVSTACLTAWETLGKTLMVLDNRENWEMARPDEPWTIMNRQMFILEFNKALQTAQSTLLEGTNALRSYPRARWWVTYYIDVCFPAPLECPTS